MGLANGRPTLFTQGASANSAVWRIESPAINVIRQAGTKPDLLLVAALFLNIALHYQQFGV